MNFYSITFERCAKVDGFSRAGNVVSIKRSYQDRLISCVSIKISCGNFHVGKQDAQTRRASTQREQAVYWQLNMTQIANTQRVQVLLNSPPVLHTCTYGGRSETDLKA